MNYARIGLAGLTGTVVYFLVGGGLFVLLPKLRDEFRKYPAVYRDSESITRVMPIGMLAMLLSIVVLAVIYALAYRGGPGVWEGARFGVLVGLFVFGAFVLHNYVNLNIGLRLTLQQALAYLVEWVAVGIAIGAVYGRR